MSWGQGEGHVRLTAVTVILAFLLGGTFPFPVLRCHLSQVWFDFKHHDIGLPHRSKLSAVGFPWLHRGVFGPSSRCYTPFLLDDKLCLNQTSFQFFSSFLCCCDCTLLPRRCFCLMLGHGVCWGEAQNPSPTTFGVHPVYHCNFVVIFLSLAGCITCLFVIGPFLGCAFRWGEALHPGPSYRFAITNPTSLVSKIDQYTKLVQDYDIHTFIAAETSATSVAQRLFRSKLRSLSMRVCWSIPV